MKTSSRRGGFGGSAWSRLSLAAVAVAGLTLASASPVAAASVPDAQVTQIGPSDPVLSLPAMAQTFKAQHTGQLSEVDLHFGDSWFAALQRVQVWTVSGGNPAVLASSMPVTARFPFTPDWHNFTLTTRVPVQAGQTYAIVVTALLTGSTRWSYNAGANYTDGKMLAQAGGGWMPFSLQRGSAFLFRTWVDTSTSTGGPQISADNTGGATGTEGIAPTMTGTYSGGGGTLTLQADHGSVAPQSGAGGSWTWTGDAYDEDNAPASVTITATDPAGHSASTTFPVKVSAVKPTASIGTGPSRAASLATGPSTPEGGSVTLWGAATTPDAADQAAGFAFSWNVTRGGAAYSSGSGASFTVAIADEGTYVVTMTAKDDGGMMSAPVSLTIVGTEITPSATITSISPADPALTIITPQESLNFAGTYSDPAPEAHTYRWDFGDGTSNTSLTASHAYAAAGTYTVRLTVADDEGAGGTATATVVVQTPQQALASMVSYVQGLGGLNGGQQQSLIAKLNAASDAAARGNNQAAHNELNAFVNELSADLSSGKISAAAFNTLRADAHAIQGALGTYNRFVDWWPLAA